MKIEAKRAVVFGGTSGIGLATVKQLAAMGAKQVIAVSRNPQRAPELPANVSTIALDVLDEAALQAFFAAQEPFDILVSAATGGARAAGPFLQMDMAAYQGSFAKLWGYANVVRFGAEHLSDSGSIVLVSGAPARKTRPGQVALGSVGGGVEAFARAVAAELAPRRINIVSPGLIDTPLIPVVGEERDSFFADATQNNLIPRTGTAEEVALAIIFAIENDFITGTTIDVDGGWLLS